MWLVMCNDSPVLNHSYTQWRFLNEHGHKVAKHGRKADTTFYNLSWRVAVYYERGFVEM